MEKIMKRGYFFTDIFCLGIIWREEDDGDWGLRDWNDWEGVAGLRSWAKVQGAMGWGDWMEGNWAGLPSTVNISILLRYWCEAIFFYWGD